MECFKHLEELIRRIEKVEWNEWIYTNVNAFGRDPLHNDYYIIPEEECWDLEEAGQTMKNHRDEAIPASIADREVQSWLEIATVQDVIDVVRRRGEEPEILLIDKALRYYHEQDAFME
ncbi:hypothetical protein C4A75_02295 [Brevibacillus laterosporus]|uniref:DUF7716 domain-containing protein n=1 Tax=Brevibacillus laterosporus TaxID=1465 RepID=UPI000CE4FABB|nr:hypothetical protein [Brevibacillus laterosporus]PPA87515.1 hypothetical protein C4A75_02295 [Brevibacillus laterosporus]